MAGVSWKSLFLACLCASGVGGHGGGAETQGSGRQLLQAPPTCTSKCGCHGIYYYGGPLMTGTIPIHLIWYGNWANRAKTQGLIQYLVEHFSESTVYQTLAEYYPCKANGKADPKALPKAKFGKAITSKLRYKKGVVIPDKPSLGQLVADIAAQGALGKPNPNALYVLLTSADVVVNTRSTGTSCSDYCGLHAAYYTGPITTALKYAHVGDLGGCPKCSKYLIYPKTGKSLAPNGDISADSMANTLAHEILEAFTDPIVSNFPFFGEQGWVNGVVENADMCTSFEPSSFKNGFGFDLYDPRNWRGGTVANQKIGTKRYLVQRNWVNKKGPLGDGYCGGTRPPL